jgi:hypothetical protein
LAMAEILKAQAALEKVKYAPVKRPENIED